MIILVADDYAQETRINTSHCQKKFKFMFQVCVDPARTHITRNDKYWVIRDADTHDAIRPYGLLLKEVP